MLAIFKKMLRDICNNKVQFASVFLMALLGIMIYSGIEGVWLGMERNSADFYCRTDAVTDWVYGEKLTENDLNVILDLDYVENGELSMQLDCSHIYRNKDNEKVYNLQVNTFQNAEINRPHIVSGESLNNEENDVTWLDDNYAKKHNLKVGDTILLRYLDKEHSVRIKGTIYSAEYISFTGSKTTLNPNHMMYGYCYVNEETMKHFLGGIQYNMCKLITEGKSNKLIHDLPNILKDRYIISYDRSNHVSVQAFTSQIQQLRSMSYMFSALFILLSLLSMQTTMKRLVETQRTQIGTLKALGFSRFQIMLHYASYGFYISVIGAALGRFCGPRIITPLLITVQKDFYTLPEWSDENSNISLAIILITILTCTLITILSCRESVTLVPAEAMRNKQIIVKSSESKRHKSKLPFELKWSVRYILRNKMRTIVGIIGIAGCLVLMMASVGLYDSLNYANHYLYGVQYNYQNKIILNDSVKDDTLDIICRELSDDAQYASERIIQIKTVDRVYPSTITAITKGYYVSFYRNMTNRNEQIVLDEDTVLISSKLAEELNIIKGQTIKIKLANDHKYQNAIITDTIYMPAPQGIIVSEEAYCRLGYDFQPNCIFTNEENMDGIRKMDGVSEVTSLEEQYQSAENVLDSAMMIVILLIMAGIVLSVIILFNLGILNFTERMREYSTLKVLGFENNEIKSIIMKDTVITSAIGILIGIPLGIWFLRLYVGTVSTMSFDYYPHIAWYYLGAVILATLLCAFAVNYIVVSKIKKLDMVEALKSVE